MRRLKKKVELAFDPDKLDDPEMQAIWADPLTRNLWIALRQGRLVDQYFNGHVKVLGEVFNDAKRRRIFSKLFVFQWLLSYQHRSFQGCIFGSKESVQEWTIVLWPYLQLQETFEWTINSSK